MTTENTSVSKLTTTARCLKAWAKDTIRLSSKIKIISTMITTTTPLLKTTTATNNMTTKKTSPTCKNLLKISTINMRSQKRRITPALRASQTLEKWVLVGRKKRARGGIVTRVRMLATPEHSQWLMILRQMMAIYSWRLSTKRWRKVRAPWENSTLSTTSEVAIPWEISTLCEDSVNSCCFMRFYSRDILGCIFHRCQANSSVVTRRSHLLRSEDTSSTYS